MNMPNKRREAAGLRVSAFRALAASALALSACFAASAAYAAPSIAFYNESDPDKVYKIEGKEPVVLATVTLEIAQPSFVLVQFHKDW